MALLLMPGDDQQRNMYVWNTPQNDNMATLTNDPPTKGTHKSHRLTTSYWVYRCSCNLYHRQNTGSVFRDLQVDQYCQTTLHPHASRLHLHYLVSVFSLALLRPLANSGSPDASCNSMLPLIIMIRCPQTLVA